MLPKNLLPIKHAENKHEPPEQEKLQANLFLGETDTKSLLSGLFLVAECILGFTSFMLLI